MNKSMLAKIVSMVLSSAVSTSTLASVNNASLQDTNNIVTGSNNGEIDTAEKVDGTEDRAAWLRGSWGLNWKPTDTYNGAGESLTIDNFLNSISHLNTIDYIQVHLNESYINSPSHLGPHDILESLWQGDVDSDGKPYNLVVPRAAANVDPFLNMITAIQAQGLKVQVYVNSSNMLERGADIPNPGTMPNITERWKAYCDTDPVVQAFINSQPYHIDENYPDRQYMFAYAEFILKEYAVRYGELINGWLFDSGSFMEMNGDNAINGVKDDQRIYGAFANAVHAGNPNAAVAFNNGPERETEELNPFSEATHYDDYMFGHPYNGGKYLGNHENGIYERNYAHIEKITATNGNVHQGGEWTWDDNVVGHFDPPMSRTRWNSGAEPGLTDEEFLLWNLESAKGGGAISWGAPLLSPPGSGDSLLIRDWGMLQLEKMDAHLAELQEPGAPNWARAHTTLPNAVFGEPYTRTLVEGVDFWDPEGKVVTLNLISDGAPAWLTLSEDAAKPGTWLLQGTPTETTTSDYQFTLQAVDESDTTERKVKLTVGKKASLYPFEGNIQIFAREDTDYGTNNIAEMISDIIVAPDGLATFQIAFDATPMAGSSIQSGTSGGVSVNTSWGIGDDNLLKGSDGESIDSITNLRVVDFKANGGELLESHVTQLAFINAEIVNGQSTGDRVLASANGVINAEGGEKMSSSPGVLDLTYGSFDDVTTVSLAVGTDADNNKWSVNHMTVSYIINGPVEPEPVEPEPVEPEPVEPEPVEPEPVEPEPVEPEPVEPEAVEPEAVEPKKNESSGGAISLLVMAFLSSFGLLRLRLSKNRK